MYMPFLMCGYAAAVLLMLAGCRLCAKSVPGMRGIHLLGWGYGAGLLGVVLMAMRPFAPAWATILVANEAIFCFGLFFYGATGRTIGVRTRVLPWAVPVMTAALVVNWYCTYIRPDLTVRILVSSAVPAFAAALTARLLFSHKEESVEGASTSSARMPSLIALGWLQMLLVVQHLVRCILTILHPPGEILHLDLIQAGYTYLNLILNLAAGCGLIWLSLCVHRRELYSRAETDGLTGLLNRRAHDEVLSAELRRSAENGIPVALMLLDIDRFKQVNDAWGHQAGDEVIRRVGRALRAEMRPTDVLARFGGEEFVVLLRNTRLIEAEAVAERLRESVANLSDLPNRTRVTISIGLAGSKYQDTPEELLLRCDQALYHSKRAGRNLVTVSQPQSGRSLAKARVS